MYTINGQLPLLNNDNAFVRSVCALSPCIETAFQPLENLSKGKKGSEKQRDHSLGIKNHVLMNQRSQNCKHQSRLPSLEHFFNSCSFILVQDKNQYSVPGKKKTRCCQIIILRYIYVEQIINYNNFNFMKGSKYLWDLWYFSSRATKRSSRARSSKTYPCE